MTNNAKWAYNGVSILELFIYSAQFKIGKRIQLDCMLNFKAIGFWVVKFETIYNSA